RLTPKIRVAALGPTNDTRVIDIIGPTVVPQGDHRSRGSVRHRGGPASGMPVPEVLVSRSPRNRYAAGEIDGPCPRSRARDGWYQLGDGAALPDHCLAEGPIDLQRCINVANDRADIVDRPGGAFRRAC